MGDFQKIATRKDSDHAEKKAWNLCADTGCFDRGTHGDVPSGKAMYCGRHYHLPRGAEAMKAWEIRNRAALEAELRLRSRLPRYEKYGKDAH